MVMGVLMRSNGLPVDDKDEEEKDEDWKTDDRRWEWKTNLKWKKIKTKLSEK